MAKAKQHKYPSRVKYESEHPVVSCRVPRELYDLMVKAKEVEGRSFTDLLELGLKIHQVQSSNISEARQDGYRKGYAEAETLYKVTYACSVCGEAALITSEEAKKRAGEHMTAEGWGHQGCHERRSRGEI